MKEAHETFEKFLESLDESKDVCHSQLLQTKEFLDELYEKLEETARLADAAATIAELQREIVPELKGDLKELREKRESAIEKCRVEKQTTRVSAQKLYWELMEFQNIANPSVKAKEFIPQTPSEIETSANTNRSAAPALLASLPLQGFYAAEDVAAKIFGSPGAEDGANDTANPLLPSLLLPSLLDADEFSLTQLSLPGKVLLAKESRAWAMTSLQQCHALLRGSLLMAASPRLRWWASKSAAFIENANAGPCFGNDSRCAGSGEVKCKLLEQEGADCRWFV